MTAKSEMERGWEYFLASAQSESEVKRGVRDGELSLIFLSFHLV